MLNFFINTFNLKELINNNNFFKTKILRQYGEDKISLNIYLKKSDRIYKQMSIDLKQISED